MSGTDTPSGPRVSVVIPTFQRPSLAVRAATSALQQTLPEADVEVIVVDSSPGNETAAAFESLAEHTASGRLRLFRKAPEGPGPARNLGASKARGQFLAFLDDDCEASPGWLSAGLAAFDDGVGLVQGRVLPHPSGRPGVLTRFVQIDEESCYYETANILYRRECFAEAGPFPTDATPESNWPTGGEDTLVAWRAKRSGWESRFAPEALAYHEVVPVGPWFWLFNKRLYFLPKLTREVPELRGFFYRRYFYDAPHALLVLALAGSATSVLSPWLLLAWMPYLFSRMTESTQTLKGLKRPIRALAYLPRDVLALSVLAAGSFRFRSLLL